MADAPPNAELIPLMQRAKQGDKQAFEQLYHYYFIPVFRYIRRRVPQTQDAEDLAQAVFLKVYTSRTAFTDQNISPLAYFFTVARSLVADHWKKNNKGEVSADEIEIPDNETSMEQKVAQQISVEQALDTLSKEQQQVLKLKFFEGCDTREIALKLQKTEMNIRQIQCRALRQLRARLLSSPA